MAHKASTMHMLNHKASELDPDMAEKLMRVRDAREFVRDLASLLAEKTEKDAPKLLGCVPLTSTAMKSGAVAAGGAVVTVAAHLFTQ